MTLGAGCQVFDSTIGPSNVVATGGCGGVGIVAGSMVSNCVIVGNTANDTGGGVNLPDGLLVDSRVISNTCKAAPGGGVRMGGGRLRNCLVAGNAATGTGVGGNPTGAGGGIYATLIGNNGGYIESCTIVSNTAYTWGGGLAINQTNNFVTNCIIYGNTVTVGADKTDVKYQALNSGTITTETNALSYCLFTSALSPWLGHGNITNANPRFVDAAAGDYRLLPASPCRDAGINQPWMVGARDLGGSARILPADGGTVDMGAYEAPVQPGALITIK